jgi:hypothetical protein
MPITGTDEIKKLVKEQLDTIEDDIVRAGIVALIVKPFCQYRQWDYGPEMYPCWVVAEHPASDTRYVYCEEGFGPASPWGIVFASGLEMGMDSGWFRTLEDAFYDSWASIPLPVWNVVKRNTTGEDRVVASSLTHTEADELIAKLNAERDMQSDSWLLYCSEPRTKVWW